MKSQEEIVTAIEIGQLQLKELRSCMRTMTIENRIETERKIASVEGYIEALEWVLK